MGSRLGRRVINFANLPIKLLLPSPPFDYISEIALKTIPSASKIEIRRVLESLYGFDVAEVRTLNVEGKKLKRGSFLAAKPDYKKAYVTLRSPLSLNPDLFPIRAIQEDRDRIAARAKSAAKATVVGGEGEEGRKKHWLEERSERSDGTQKGYVGKRAEVWQRFNGGGGRRRGGSGRGGESKKGAEGGKFPWSSMRLSSK